MSTISTMKQTVAVPETGGDTPRWIHVMLDHAVTGTIAQNDILEVLNCVGEVVVHKFAYEIQTACTASLTIEAGKAGGTELSTAFAADAAAGTLGVGTNTVDVTFKDDTVDIQFTGAAFAAGKILLHFLVSDLTKNGYSTLRA